MRNDRARWDARYGEGDRRHDVGPSPLLLEWLPRWPAGRALDVAAGLGRHALLLAQHGWSVDAVDISLEGLRVLNENNWFPMMTLMVGNPGETDEDVKATLDLVHEMERRRLFAFLVPSIFTPLHDTRMAREQGVTETRNLSRFQWQLIMKCWKHNLRPGTYSWWGPWAYRIGGIALWALRLRRTNGPQFTWPLLMFTSALPERAIVQLGKLHPGQVVRSKSRKELLASVRRNYWRHFRADCGDLPNGWEEVANEPAVQPLTLTARAVQV